MIRKSSKDAQARFRKGNPGYKLSESQRTTARYRAMSALARKHPAEYLKLYEAELEKLRS